MVSLDFMQKWFNLFDEWLIEKKYYWSDIKRKELWQLFVIDIRRVNNIEQDKKLNWFKLDFDKSRKLLVPNKVGFDSCFEIKEIKVE